MNPLFKKGLAGCLAALLLVSSVTALGALCKRFCQSAVSGAAQDKMVGARLPHDQRGD